MEKEDQKNFILALVLMVGFLWLYQSFIVDPRAKAREAAEAQRQEEIANAPPEPERETIQRAATREEALADPDRKAIAFDGPKVSGSINLKGARIDNLTLDKEKILVDSDESIHLFRPETGPNGYYAAYGWSWPEMNRETQKIGKVGTDKANWKVRRGSPETLTPSSPVVIEFENSNIKIEREISLDDNYMFTFVDTVTNKSSGDLDLDFWGSVNRFGRQQDFLPATDPKALPNGELLAHEGKIGILNNELKLRKYKALADEKTIKGSDANGFFTSTQGGWIGLTDKYWMGVLIPQQDLAFTASTTYKAAVPEKPNSIAATRINVSRTNITLQPGESTTVTNRIFAGSKRLEALRAYEKELDIPRFNDAIDWGMFYFLTKPFYSVIMWLKGLLGSFGLAILGFTVLVKLVLFPLYNSSYRSMAKMKKLSEPMKEIRERFAADRQRQQQEIMKLYKETGANPIAGCLPILATIPIFFALYKTLYVTIEMRHESFLWLNDLAAPDPTAALNLFGALGFLFTAESIKSIPLIGFIIGIGALPILYGVTMWAMQSLNPEPEDPMQKRIFALLPIIFTFVFAGFAGGLVLYFVWNNILTLLQQYTIMRRQGVETRLGTIIAKRLGKKEGA